MPLADGAYIELLGFWEPALETRRWAMPEAGGGLCEFMLTAADVAADIAAANARGAGYGAPVAGSRERPDGIAVAWRDGPAPAGLPYLIEDVTAREIRVPAGDARVHANGVRGLARLTLAVADLEGAARAYAALLGAEPTQGAAATASFTIGRHILELCEPPADSARARHLAARGDGPYSVAFHGAAPVSITA